MNINKLILFLLLGFTSCIINNIYIFPKEIFQLSNIHEKIPHGSVNEELNPIMLVLLYQIMHLQ